MNKLFRWSFVTMVFVFSLSTALYAQTTRNAGTYAELTAAYSASADGDIINITNNIVVMDQLTISKSITLNGNNFAISVPNPGLNDMGAFNATPSAFRVFEFNTADKSTILNNLTIKGGNASSAGGAIWISSSRAILTLNKCTISNSRTTPFVGGGGIYNQGVLYMNGSNIIRNSAEYGGGLLNTGGIAYLESCTMSENRATSASGSGGAVENNSSGKIYFNNSTLSNNQSYVYGGAISNLGSTLYFINSSATGNVVYSAPSSCKGGVVLTIGASACFYAVNSLFAYNYKATGGSDTNPTNYVLDDIIGYTESSDNANIKFYNCIYHATLPVTYPIGVSVSNIQFTGNINGSDNTIFSGGNFSKLTDINGNEIGEAIYRPFLYNNSGSVAPTLKSGSFVLSNLGTSTRYANNNNVNPVVAYYNGSSYVDLTGTSASGQEVLLDQVGTARPNPPACGAIQGTIDNLYMVKVLGAPTGTVNGGTLYGDVYPSGTSVNITSIPNTGYSFTRYDYVLGGSGTASSSNPYTFTLSSDITLQPVFTELAGGSYSINYLGNGNTGGTVPAAGIFSASTTIATQGTLVRAGYSFNGWNTNSNGSGTAYASSASYSSVTNLALYAQWALAAPTITGFTPSSAGTGTTVTITGTNFTGATAVSFGGTAATSFSVVSATSITAVVANGTSGSVSVTTPGGTVTLSGFTLAMVPPGNALALDGVNDFVNAGDNTSVKISTGTIEAWIKTAAAGSGYRAIVVKQWAYSLFLSNNVLTVFEWYNGSGGAEYSTGINLADNRWHHIAFSFNSGVTNGSFIYIDGVLTNTITYSSATQSGIQNVGLAIGQGSIASAEQNFNGSIDEVRVWNTVRTQSELQSNMYFELAGNESGLVAYYNFNQGIAGGDNTGITTLNDKTSNANNGTLTGFAKSGTSSNFVESYGLVVPIPAAATSITGTGFTANWTAPACGTVTSYKLDVSTVSIFSSFVTGYNGLDCGTSLSQAVSGLALGTAYYYRVRSDKTSVTGTGGYYRTPALVTTSAFTWTGATDTDWNTSTNWNSGTVPIATDNITIPDVTNKPIVNHTGSSALCNTITINSGAVVTIPPGKALTVSGTFTNNSTLGVVIQSDATGTGSLIVGTSAGSGTTVAQRWMSAGSWHLVSSPVFQTVTNFLGANDNIAKNGSARGMMDYDPTSNSWNAFFTNGSTNGNLGAGRGFSLRLTVIPEKNDAAVTATGPLQAGNLSAGGLTAAKWNCVGNPYSSAIGINAASTSGATNNFITVNSTNLDSNYGAIYVWDKTDGSNGIAGNYAVISNVTPNNASFDVQQGQAFMVLMDAGKSSVDFTPAMQFHNGALALKSAQAPWPTIKLVASANAQSASTIIAFNEGMTKGLDRTYDAGLLRGGSDVQVYTRLVEAGGNTIPFAIQALPDQNFNEMIIPVGVESKIGGDVVFSSETTNLPSNCKVILEDKLTKTFTDLSANVYKAAIMPNSTVADRFQLHTSTATIGAIGQSILSGKLNAYAIGNTGIRVVGEVSGKAVAALYDVLGKAVLMQKLSEGTLNVIPLSNIKPGVYILSVEDKGITNFKLRIVN